MTENNFSNDFFSPVQIRFGMGAISSIHGEVTKANSLRVFIVSDKGVENAGLISKLKYELEQAEVIYQVSSELTGEPSQEDVLKNVTLANEFNADLVVGIGGGASLDVAKTTAALYEKEDLELYLNGEIEIVDRQMKCILLPTTAGTGAEVTRNAIFENKEEQIKKGIVSTALLPDLAIIDPELTISCPAKVTASSGVDAFTHALESYISTKATLQTKMYAEKAISLFGDSISSAVHNGEDLIARTNMAWVSLLGGVSLANAGVGAVHAMAYPLGGKYHIEHGVANALLLPYVLKVVGTTCEKELIEIAKLLGLGDFNNTRNRVVDEIVNYLLGLLDVLNLPTTLKELGVKQDSLSNLAEQAVEVKRLMNNTPYHLDQQQVLEIYENAFKGGFDDYGKL